MSLHLQALIPNQIGFIWFRSRVPQPAICLWQRLRLGHGQNHNEGRSTADLSMLGFRCDSHNPNTVLLWQSNDLLSTRFYRISHTSIEVSMKTHRRRDQRFYAPRVSSYLQGSVSHRNVIVFTHKTKCQLEKPVSRLAITLCTRAKCRFARNHPFDRYCLRESALFAMAFRLCL